jgi:hypothetical protein
MFYGWDVVQGMKCLFFLFAFSLHVRFFLANGFFVAQNPFGTMVRCSNAM